MKKIFLMTIATLLVIASGCTTDKKIKVSMALKNDDILHGELNSMSKGSLRMKHEFLGNTTVKWEGVRNIETDVPARVELDNGDVIDARFAGSDGKKITLMDAKGEKRDVPIKNVISVNLPPNWRGDVTFVYSHLAGNTEEDNLGLKLSTEREDRYERMQVKASYDYGESQGELIKKRGDSKIKYDYKLSPKWYLFAAASIAYDRLIELDIRTSVNLGAGWKVYDVDRGKLNLEVGSQYTDEQFDIVDSEIDGEFTEGTFAAEWLLKIMPDLSFKQTVDFSIPFDDVDSWRATTESTFLTKLSNVLTWKLGYIHKTDQGPPEGVERNDGETFTALTVNF